jgi:DNA polymerase III subunit delta'
MPFASDIAGHAMQLATLRHALEQDRLHHAYVFVGPEGVGKRTLALSLAKAIHCSEATRDFCGGCASCLKIENKNHPDVRLIGPLAGKKEISIEQVRALEKELNYHAFAGGKKIGIIDPAELMNFSAQNALLKTLEEPPSGSLLILITTSAGALLPTLLSRCLRLAFGPLPQRDVERRLLDRRDMSAEQARALASVSLGSLGRALSPDIQDLAEKRQSWIEALTAPADAAAWAALAEELAKDRAETLQFLDWLAEWYRDLLVFHATQTTDQICNRDLLEKFRAQVENVTVSRALKLRACALAASGRVRRNVNRRLALENLLVRIAGISGS